MVMISVLGKNVFKVNNEECSGFVIVNLEQGAARCHAQQTFTCSKSTIETVEKVRNMFEVNNKTLE